VLDQLIRKLGSVEIDAAGLEIEIDGRRVSADSVIKIAVAAAKDAPPVSAKSAANSDEEEEWEWQIALARARAAEPAVAAPAKPPIVPRALAADIQSLRVRTLRSRLGRRRLAHGTAPPVPSDDDVTRPIDIRPLPGTSPIKREPPPLPPPPED